MMGFKTVAYVVTEGSIMSGRRVTSKMINEGIYSIIDGTCEVAIMSILVGGAGLNCQTMNRIIFMDPPTTDVQKRQAKGTHGTFHQLMI